MQTFSSFIQILQTNGRFKPDAPKINTFDDSRLFCITMLAWISAVIAMIIAIGFLSNDFYIAQKNFAAFIDQVNVSNVAYPAVTVCADIPRAPLFLNYPNKKYPGVPLFGLTRFSARNSTSGQMHYIAFPDTIPTGNNYFEEVVSGPYPAACKAMKKSTSLALNQKALFHLGDLFEAEGGRAKAALTNSSQECYWCIRAGFTPRVEAKVENHDGGDSGPSAPPFQLTFFRSKLVAGCTTLLGFRDAGTRGFIVAQLENHARALAERGTLDFANQSASKALQAVSFGFNHSSFLRSVDYRAAMEFACNVYFYSGYFYPTDDAPDIRYRYEHRTKSWMQTGAGPYYQTQAWDKNAPALLGPGQVGVERDLYTTNIAQVLFQDPDKKTENKGFVPMSAKIANIEADGVIFLDIERTSDNGKVDYKVDIQGIGSQTNEALGYSSFSIGMAYKSPFTTSIDYVATMSWSEYLTDVFEFVGLFTGVCVFTLLVAPAHSFVE